jgi:hypothetical protein
MRAGRGDRLQLTRPDREAPYGTFHITPYALSQMRSHMEQRDRPSEVHGIFGEGVNPRMRKIREGLDMLGLDSDYILQTGSPRAVYVIPLARNFREVLLGRETEPEYTIPGDDPERATAQIAEFWRTRWLQGRIGRPGILEAVSRHTLTSPVTHGARVVLPAPDEDELALPFETDDAREDEWME